MTKSSKYFSRVADLRVTDLSQFISDLIDRIKCQVYCIMIKWSEDEMLDFSRSALIALLIRLSGRSALRDKMIWEKLFLFVKANIFVNNLIESKLAVL